MSFSIHAEKWPWCCICFCFKMINENDNRIFLSFYILIPPRECSWVMPYSSLVDYAAMSGSDISAPLSEQMVILARSEHTSILNKHIQRCALSCNKGNFFHTSVLGLSELLPAYPRARLMVMAARATSCQLTGNQLRLMNDRNSTGSTFCNDDQKKKKREAKYTSFCTVTPLPLPPNSLHLTVLFTQLFFSLSKFPSTTIEQHSSHWFICWHWS